MTDRRLPRPSDFADLLVFRRPTVSPTTRRLSGAHTIDDLRRIAKRVTPKAPFDYTDGAAEQELSLARARQAFHDIEFHPAILRDVSDVDTSLHRHRRTECAAVRHRADRVHPDDAHRGRARRRRRGGRGRHPVLALHGRHHDARGRGRRQPRRAATGSSSTCGRTAIGRWTCVDRAAAAGFDTLLVTVDVPVARRPAPRSLQRPDHPARRSPPAPCSTRSHGPVVVRLPHHRAARASPPSSRSTARSPSCSTRCSTRPSTSTTSPGSRTSGPARSS